MTRDVVGQLLMVGFHGTTCSPEWRDWLQVYRPGGVILFARNVVDPEQVARLTNDLQACAPNPPLLIAIDEEGGRVSRLPRGFTTFPAAGLVAAHHSPDVAYDIAEVTARELRAVGINMNMAPVLDVNSCPANPVIGDRAYGDHPGRVCAFGTAVMEGLRANGVIPCGKHFPGHGDTMVDSHIMLPVVNADRMRLDTLELVPFRHAIRQGIPAIMTAHVRYPALDASAPATLSRSILTGLLRSELSFHGVTLTDDMEMGAILNHGSTGEASVSALRAGADMLLLCHRRERQREAVLAIERALERDELSREQLTASVDRIRALKKQYLLPGQAPPPSFLRTQESRAVGECQGQTLNKGQTVDLTRVAQTVGHPRHAGLLETVRNPALASRQSQGKL
ncbi:MAG: beta-N-acetylhexosaminidase [Nitrospira sp.]|nr:beta-N-acetylhexosaminidase [Nitrospira sp.]